MGLYKSKVLSQKAITSDIYHMCLKASEIAQESHPGQFVHIRIGQGIDPLLRRPFSIHRVNREKRTVELLYRIVGRGTKWMQKLSPGDFIDLMGPLGTGFLLEGAFTHGLIVAGGMGSAPVFFLIDELLALQKHVTLLWGVKKEKDIFGLSDLKNSGVDIELVTEDGSLGQRGLVTDLLRSFLEAHREDRSFKGFVCGPLGMLKQVQELVKKTILGWEVSLEERMACGVGVCMGCGVKTRQEGYKMVCSDGPVFNICEVVFDG